MNADYAWDGVHIETIHPPAEYSERQIEFACLVWSMIRRGKLIVAEPPDEVPA